MPHGCKRRWRIDGQNHLARLLPEVRQYLAQIFLHNYIFEPSEPYDINQLTNLSVSESAAPFYKKYHSAAAATFSTREVQTMRPKVHADLTKLHADLVFSKTHNAALTFHDVPLITEAVTAGAIYIIRDPRDIAVSYARYTGRELDEIIGFMAHTGAANKSTNAQVFEYLSSWSNHVASWAARPKTLLLRYEDLITDPAKPFGAVVRYLGQQPDPARLEKAIAFSRFEIAAAQERAKGYNAAGSQRSAFFRNGKAGAWRETLNSTQRETIETAHTAMMKKSGYLD